LEEPINGSNENNHHHQHHLKEPLTVDQVLTLPISDDNSIEEEMENTVPDKTVILTAEEGKREDLELSSSLVSNSDLQRRLSSSKSSLSLSSSTSDLSLALQTNQLSPEYPFAPPLTYKKFLTMQVSERTGGVCA
jgi:hypothetical protein